MVFWTYVLVSCLFGCVGGKSYLTWWTSVFILARGGSNRQSNRIECGGLQQCVSMFAALFARLEAVKAVVIRLHVQLALDCVQTKSMGARIVKGKEASFLQGH